MSAGGKQSDAPASMRLGARVVNEMTVSSSDPSFQLVTVGSPKQESESCLGSKNTSCSMLSIYIYI